MPALPPVPNVLRMTVEGTNSGGQWANVLHWGYTGTAPTTTNLNAFAAVLGASWVAAFQAYQVSASVIQKTTAVDLSASTGSIGEAAVGTAGTEVGGEIPASSAVVISKTIARRYRGGHARTYLALGCTTDLDDATHWAGALTAAALSGYENVDAAMGGHVEGGTTLTTEVIVSYIDKATNPVPPYRRPTPLVFPVTGVLVRSRIGTQRRRIGH